MPMTVNKAEASEAARRGGLNYYGYVVVVYEEKIEIIH